jgi:hypothetical protein
MNKITRVGSERRERIASRAKDRASPTGEPFTKRAGLYTSRPCVCVCISRQNGGGCYYKRARIVVVVAKKKKVKRTSANK